MARKPRTPKRTPKSPPAARQAAPGSTKPTPADVQAADAARASEGRQEAPRPPELEPRQRRFVDEYLKDLNATKAAIRAGYSPKTARSVGSENLAKPAIRHALDLALADRALRTRIEADAVLLELARIGFSRIRHFTVGDAGELALLKDAPADADAAVASVRVKHKSGPFGDEHETELRLWPKVPALELLGRHVGLFPNKLEVTGKGGGPIQVRDVQRMSDAELKAFALKVAAEAAAL